MILVFNFGVGVGADVDAELWVWIGEASPGEAVPAMEVDVEMVLLEREELAVEL